jgi:AbrB family looped-hinge helix DNA binding protein
VIPREVRERLGLRKGDRVAFVEYAGMVTLHRVPEDPIAAAYGMLKGGPSMTEALLRDRQEELEREERDLPPPKRSAG